MRILRPVFCFICGVMLLAAQAAHAEGALQNQELFEKSGVTDAVNGIPDALAEGLDDVGKANPRIDAKFLAAWKAAVPIAYRADKILAVIDAGVQKDLTVEEKRAIIAFFDTDLGKRVTALEKMSNTASAEIKEYAKNPAAFADRVDLYSEIDRVSGASDAGAEILENMAVAMQVGILTALNQSVDIGKLKAEAENDRRTVRQEVESETLKTMAYTYRSLSVEEIKTYIEFLKTPAARKFNITFSRFLNDALTAQAGSLGQMLIQNITSSQPI